MSLRPATISAIVHDGHGKEQDAASELIGCVAALARELDDDGRLVVAWTLLKLAAKLDASIQLRPVH